VNRAQAKKAFEARQEAGWCLLMTGDFQGRLPTGNRLSPVLGFRVRDLIPLRGGGRGMPEQSQRALAPEKYFVILQTDNCNGKK
jgi:hypothetical protein